MDDAVNIRYIVHIYVYNYIELINIYRLIYIFGESVFGHLPRGVPVPPREAWGRAVTVLSFGAKAGTGPGKLPRRFPLKVSPDVRWPDALRPGYPGFVSHPPIKP